MISLARSFMPLLRLIYSVASVKRRAGLIVVAMHWWLVTWLDNV